MTHDAYIHDEHHLAVVPDGTVISWLRIPGDPTSEAVAFVRREVDYDNPTVHGGPHATVWISPGGWDPMTIEQAGVTFPAHVIRWGDVSTEVLLGDEVPALVETLESGGSYARTSALDASARVNAGTTATTDQIIADADRFLAWLRADDQPAIKTMLELPDPEDPIVQAQADAAVRAYRAWETGEGDPTAIVRGDDRDRLLRLADETDWAAEVHQVNRHVSTRAIRDYANGLVQQ